jgi:hypothetical protein
MIALTHERRLIEVQAFDGQLHTLAPFEAEPASASQALEDLQAVIVNPSQRTGYYRMAVESH